MENFFSLTILFAAAIAFVATLMQSITGFGLAIIATPLLLMLYTPQDVVLILQILSLFINVFFGIFLRKELDLRFFLILAASATVGQLVAFSIYRLIPAAALKILVSSVILLFLLVLRFQQKTITETKPKTCTAGFFSGLLNVLTSMSGPPLILYLANTKRSNSSIRATCIIYFAFTNVTAILGFIIAKQDLSFAINQSLYILPAALLGLWLGNLIFPHVSQKLFKKVIFIMLLFSSLYTIGSLL